MSDPDPMTATGTPPSASGSVSVSEVTGLISIFAGMLNTMQSNILGRLDDNSRAASERWARHDQELERNREAVIGRFMKVEGALATQIDALNGHLERKHDEDVALNARIKPVKTFGGWLARNWRTVLLLAISILAVLGFAGDTFSRIFGR